MNNVEFWSTDGGGRSVLQQWLIDEYLATDYGVRYDPSFALRIGVPSDEVRELQSGAAVTSSAYITAWNPRGKSLADNENAARHKQLINRLTELGLKFITGAALGRNPAWPAEESLLILGMDRELACKIGREFEQNAIVMIDENAVPTLLLLR